MQQMEAEEQRRLRENLSEEELAIFDLLTKPRPDLTQAERDQVKEVARDMLDTLKAEYLLLDWRKQQQTRAAVKQAIEEGLDALPDAYGIDLYDEKCTAVYTHIYDNYYGAGHSIYH